ncbi:MAG: arsenite methyltransferase, partial [Actinomycetota bacterium]
MSDVRESVRDHYAQAAQNVGSNGCGCGDSCGTSAFGSSRYPESDRAMVPDEAALASLGCGNPIEVAVLRPGEVVLDLGSGGGIDVLLSARRVGAEGKVYGLDMTEEMLALAVANRDKAGVRNVEFLRGYIEDVPLPASTVDVVISNCVINLSPDKDRVFAEIFRVLRPGGRIGVTDIVAEDRLSAAERSERGSYAGCIAGALSFSELEDAMERAGFVDVSVTSTHAITDGIHSTIIKASKPA